jgi:hypothetical protein
MFAHPARTRHHVVARHHRAPMQQYAGTGTNLAIAGGITLFIVAAAVPTLVVGPWIVKAFKPEWSYGRRLAASFGVSFVAGTLISVAKGIGGVSEAGATSTPATTK